MLLPDQLRFNHGCPTSFHNTAAPPGDGPPHRRRKATGGLHNQEFASTPRGESLPPSQADRWLRIEEIYIRGPSDPYRYQSVEDWVFTQQAFCRPREERGTRRTAVPGSKPPASNLRQECTYPAPDGGAGREGIPWRPIVDTSCTQESRRDASRRRQLGANAKELRQRLEEEMRRVDEQTQRLMADKRKELEDSRLRAQEEAARRERERQQQRRAEEVRDRWERYEARWNKLLTSTEPLSFETIPWPTVRAPKRAEDINAVALSSFLMSSAHSPSLSPKERLKKAQLRWHPDRFLRISSRVKDADRRRVEEAAGAVARCLNEMMEKEKGRIS